MKVLYVGMEHGSYGSPGHEARVARFLAEQGHEVHLVTDHPVKWETEPPATLRQEVAPLNEGTPGVRLAQRAGAPPDPWAGRTWGERVVADWPEADVGFASSVSGAPFLAAWKQRTGKPVIAQILDIPLWRLRWRERGPWWASWRPWYEGLLAMDRLVVNTEQTKRDLLELARLYEGQPYDPQRVEVVYYGVDTDAADAASPASLPHGVPLVGCVGRLVPYRGVDTAIMALSLIPRSIQPRLVVVGGGDDLERVVLLASLAGVECIFRGPCSDRDKWATIKACDLGLALQHNPNIPQQAGTEFLYAEKPCIVSDLPIHRERTGEYAQYAHPFDPGEVALKIQQELEQEPDVLAAGKRFVAEHRSFRSHAAGVLKVLKEVQG